MLVPGAPVTVGPLAACACGTGGVALSVVKWPYNLVMKLSMDVVRLRLPLNWPALADHLDPLLVGRWSLAPNLVGGSGLEL